jgi:hypothetical protein
MPPARRRVDTAAAAERNAIQAQRRASAIVSRMRPPGAQPPPAQRPGTDQRPGTAQRPPSAQRPGADTRAAAHTGASPRGGCDLLAAARMLARWLATIPRRLGDQLFAPNDAEARWRGWQVTRLHGGLGRRYRDPLFDALGQLVS